MDFRTLERTLCLHPPPFRSALSCGRDGLGRYDPPRSGISSEAPGPCISLEGHDDKCETWEAVYDNPMGYEGNGFDVAHGIAPGHDGLVYVTGASWNAGTNYDAVTVAYDTATGAERWVARYDGPTSGRDISYSVGVSSDGQRVFAAGVEDAGAGRGDFLVIAYDASSGALLWAKTYDGGSDSADAAIALSAGPTGDRLYVTGAASASGSGLDYLTMALRGSTGEQLWVTRSSSEADGDDIPRSIGVSPDGRSIYVTGFGAIQTELFLEAGDFYTVAYVAVDEKEPQREGRELWSSRYEGSVRGVDGALSLDTSPDGRLVYVAGWSDAAQSTLSLRNTEYATVAYEAPTGRQIWASRHGGSGVSSVGASLNAAYDVAVDPEGEFVYVTGGSSLVSLHQQFSTIAYIGATGEEVWISEYLLPAHSTAGASSVEVSPDGASVYVVGQSGAVSVSDNSTHGVYGNQLVTLAYEAQGGGQDWVARYAPLGATGIDPFTRPLLALGPGGRNVVATASFRYPVNALDPGLVSGLNYQDFWTVAYGTDTTG